MPVACVFCGLLNSVIVSLVANNITENVRLVTTKVEAAAVAANRTSSDIQVIGVSKRHSASAIEAAAAAGISHFGENYLQEAQAKLPGLAHLPVQWHFLGALQSNKTRWVAEHFDWVHTVSRMKIAHRLSSQRAALGSAVAPLNVLLQVNIDADPDKAGCTPEQSAVLLRDCLQLPAIRVRGLMTILNQATPALTGYAALAKLFEQLRAIPAREDFDTLSMGMSADYPDAITAGATLVRVGTAIFGPRP